MLPDAPIIAGVAPAVSMPCSADVFDWINASWSGNYSRKNGAVVATDHKLDAVSQREFFNALVTETTILNLGIFRIGPDKTEANSDRITTWPHTSTASGWSCTPGAPRPRSSGRQGRQA